MTQCRLYLITPPRIADLAVFADTLAAALDAGDVACLQVRLKDVDDDAIRRAVDVLRPVTEARDVALIMNDRADLAAKTGCDGVHLGQTDGSLKDARKLLGETATIGITCHDSRHLAMAAAEGGGDYVAFGAFFDTATKDPKARANPDILSWWQGLSTVPCVAIGGITVDNAPALIRAGADFLAVVGGVWNHADGPAEAVRRFNRLFAENSFDAALIWT